ncbi:hypothetical protein Tco_0383474 [Tanacetum coccineum]
MIRRTPAGDIGGLKTSTEVFTIKENPASKNGYPQNTTWRKATLPPHVGVGVTCQWLEVSRNQRSSVVLAFDHIDTNARALHDEILTTTPSGSSIGEMGPLEF